MYLNFCRRLSLFLSCFLLALSSAVLYGQLPAIQEEQGVTGLGLALRKLPTVGSVLYITAHPDDENNALLSMLSRGQGYRTGLLTLTRGDGGQNEIGPELFQALGVLRTEELMTIHRFDGVEQFFTRAYEFGYSFSVEETLEKWDKQEVLRDIVRVIRTFRPHVILTLNPEGTGGGQHHQASARLAAEAFQLAADPNSFPEQLANEGLRPWQVSRLYQAARPREEQDEKGNKEEDDSLAIETGIYDPLLGETYAEFGARARSNHRCQGMNVLPEPGPRETRFRMVASTLSESNPQPAFFEGLDFSLASLAQYSADLGSALTSLTEMSRQAEQAFLRSDYAGTQQAVMRGLEVVRKLQSKAQDPELKFRLAEKEKDFLKAAAKAGFIHFDAFIRKTGDENVTPEESFLVEVRFLSQGPVGADLQSVELKSPANWDAAVEKEEGFTHTFKVQVPSDADYTQPYWFRENPQIDRFSVRPGFSGNEAVTPPELTALARFSAYGVSAVVEAPVQYRWFDAASGTELRTGVKVVPEVSLQMQPALAVVPLGSRAVTREFRVSVQNDVAGKSEASVWLEAPDGWTVEPQRRALQFQYENERVTASFQIRVPDGIKQGDYLVRALADRAGKIFNSGFENIAYPHIESRHLFQESVSRVKVFPVEIPEDLKVGYVMGVGDDVAAATRDLGADVTLLNEAALAYGDLQRFDVIITGIRAYLNRDDLVANNHRLLNYVKSGGHLVVQYNKYEWNRAPYGPYPTKISRPHDRITVEESPVRVLDPDHPFFHFPNEIQVEDWQGWVQERGLYFLGEWDEHYKPLLELQDPWPYNDKPKQGSLLIADYGKGTFVYTGLGFFRQLPEGVPGAYRLWANIISLGRK